MIDSYFVQRPFRNGELSDPLCDSVNRGLTLVRLIGSNKINLTINTVCIHIFFPSLKISLEISHHILKVH